MHEGCNTCYIYHLPRLTPPCQATPIRGAGPALIRLVPKGIDRRARALQQSAAVPCMILEFKDMRHGEVCILAILMRDKDARHRPLLPHLAFMRRGGLLCDPSTID